MDMKRHLKSALKQLGLDKPRKAQIIPMNTLDAEQDAIVIAATGSGKQVIYETADIEFELLLSQAMQKGNNLAHHLIQSFAPGETTPEQAHEIGRQLADEVLQGKFRDFFFEPFNIALNAGKSFCHTKSFLASR